MEESLRTGYTFSNRTVRARARAGDATEDPQPQNIADPYMSHPGKTNLDRPAAMVCLFLVIAILAVYWQVVHQDFINFDDNSYVTENPHVQAGLSWQEAGWAFTNTSQAGLWIPLTWLSLMADHDLFGDRAGGYKLTNLLLHLCNTLLLFLLIKTLTGSLWRSAFVAAAFALHPLRVESVAWVTERKDVLSALFWLLAIWSYKRYVTKPERKRYLLLLLFFTLGLMAKPMLVTLPFALLLLDYWPLARMAAPAGTRTDSSPYPTPPPGNWPARQIIKLVLEKLPLLAIAAAVAFGTILAQRSYGAVETLELLPGKFRLANGLTSYLGYIAKTFWPISLGVLYPHPGAELPIWQGVMAGLVITAISLTAILTARRHPYFPVGWFWFLGTLLPVIGFVQAGDQAMADRFTYLPGIGLLIMVAWGIPELLAGWRHRKTILVLLASSALSAMLLLSWIQVGYWDNGIALYQHTLSLTKNNWLIENNLGATLLDRGQLTEALPHFTKALTILPDYPDAHYNLGRALNQLGRPAEAADHFAEAIRIQPDYLAAHNNLGVALAMQGKTAEAIVHYQEALRLKPDYAETHNNLGLALLARGRPQEAAAHFAEALRLKPDCIQAQTNLEMIRQRLGRN